MHVINYRTIFRSPVGRACVCVSCTCCLRRDDDIFREYPSIATPAYYQATTPSCAHGAKAWDYMRALLIYCCPRPVRCGPKLRPISIVLFYDHRFHLSRDGRTYRSRAHVCARETDACINLVTGEQQARKGEREMGRRAEPRHWEADWNISCKLRSFRGALFAGWALRWLL